MQTIDPANDKPALRAALGRFATGVTLVTVAGPKGPLGMTANSFTSVSLEPPLILWCPACASARHDAMVGAARFALHVLAEDQEEIAHGFSQAGDAFDKCVWRADTDGLPLIDGCTARFVCETETRLPAGDHSIVLARLISAETNPQSGLVFASGRYRRLSSS